MKTSILITLLLVTLNLFSQKGREWIERYDNQMEVNDQKVSLTMKLFSKNGNLRERKLKWSTMENAEGLSSSYIVFDAPADIAGTAFLSIERSNGGEDQWLYLPVLRRSRRISSNEKSSSFMGSDFSYADIGNENTDNSTYELIETIAGDEREVKVIEALHNSEDRIEETGYAKRIIFIDVANNMMIKTDYYNTDEEHVKQLECSDFKVVDGTGKLRAHRYEMKDLQKGTSTVLLFENYQINKGLDPGIFTIRNLENN
ncbi:MAG: outer membrane lipoprotein-sorting protein [Prolixibacteraceae bacterium]|nr:outer membrane lipoprotein-sorting protein [Prolixibacteraceae bacterium]